MLKICDFWYDSLVKVLKVLVFSKSLKLSPEPSAIFFCQVACRIAAQTFDLCNEALNFFFMVKEILFVLLDLSLELVWDVLNWVRNVTFEFV